MSKNKKNQNTAVATEVAPANAQPIENAAPAAEATSTETVAETPAVEAAPVAEAPKAETKPEVVVIPFVLADQADLPLAEAFIAAITSDEGKKDYKSFYQRYKNMITGYSDWKLITEKKYKNLQKLVAEFEKTPAPVKAAPAAAPKAEEVATPAAEAVAEPVAEVATEEAKA